MANLLKPSKEEEKVLKLPSNIELCNRLDKKLKKMKEKDAWPGIKYKEEEMAMSDSVKQRVVHGAAAGLGVILGFGVLQRFVTGPLTVTRTPFLMGLQVALVCGSVIVVNDYEQQQLMPRLSEIEHSVTLDELCPHYLKHQEHYRRDIYSSTFSACEKYCKRKGTYREIMGLQQQQ
uniref:Uncharacterized protein n=1 Tax=Eutreptiella gymnastica TaxID=73025 RepID=A0A7S4FMY2_9EUGL